MNQKLKAAAKKELFDDDASNDSSSSSSSTSSVEQKNNDGSTNGSSSSESKEKLIVNKKFAKDYQERKQREELRQISQQRRDIGLGSDDDEESSSDEEEDEDGRLLTDSMNLQFLKTMKALKNKDSSIYDPKSRFFQENDPDDDEENDDDDKKKRKPKKFKDVLRDQILEDMEKENDEDEGEMDKTTTLAKSKFAYDDQQEALRKAFLKETGEDDENDGEDDWMVIKKKGVPGKGDATATEIQEEFKVLEELSSKKKGTTFSDPRGEVHDGERFLIDFMKNKKWVDKDERGDHDMNEAVDQEVAKDEESSIEDLDRADEFEAQYNFRFEQAAAEMASSGAPLSIQTYARGQTMNTLRRQDATRKEKRQARKERKEAERKAKEEQLKRLKNAKRQEVEKKLSQVKAVIGAVDEEAIDEAAILKMLEGDYDPEQFEKAMQEAYGDDFYQKQDPEWKSDVDVRAALQNDEEGDVIVGQDGVDVGLYDDYADGQDDDEAENWDEEDDNEEYLGGDESKESHLEKKIKSKLQDELYKLDYEDIVAGMPTRFKYRQVEPNDFGLTTQEILLARDTTLKQFVSLKKLAPYNESGEHHVGSKKRRRFRELLKNDLLEQMEDEEAVDHQIDDQDNNAEQEGHGKKKRRRLKKGKKKSDDPSIEKNDEEIVSESLPTESEGGAPEAEQTKKRRRKKGKKVEDILERTEKSEDSSNEHTKTKDESQKNLADGNNDTLDKPTKRRKAKKTKKVVSSLPKSRLASYGL